MTLLSSLSTSQRVLRALMGAAATAVALASWLATPGGSLIAALGLVVLTAFVVLDPGSRRTTLLMALLAAVWLWSAPAPSSLRHWALTFLVALALLVVHLAGALATVLPPAAPVPAATLRRWLRRGVGVVLACVPVWSVMIVATRAAAPGDAFLMYAALAGLVGVGAALALSTRPPKRAGTDG
ncbi:hypothetical protein BCF74_11937 [Knoellia remsis]|uniref:Uncharacterized protein n=1 Tax=Knoellia remsis TaxID=407159 RepID=A0A2T0UEF6_9MICO|nr:hypothetical protein [Knoellia remsis]PRY56320.1 hypothetical protein BCF74_11937 [Knoellia remsis]